MLWNAALIAGLGSIAAGFNDGLEWLEIPWQIDILFVVGGALIGLPLVFTLQNRQVEHLYVSIWYMGAALFWFPVLFLVGNLPGVHFGVEGATMKIGRAPVCTPVTNAHLVCRPLLEKK